MKNILSLLLSVLMLFCVTALSDISAFSQESDDYEYAEEHTHTYETVLEKATDKKNGSKVTKCTECGYVKSTATIYKASSIRLSKTSYVYNGKAKKPTVTVKDSKGNKIASGNYEVKYSSRKAVGQATVKIIFKNNYSGTVKKTYKIKPKATSISKVTPISNGFTVKWKKKTTQTTGYQIQYATDGKFTKNKKTVTVSKKKTTNKTISKLKPNEKYYVRVRTYKTVKIDGKSTKLYSEWSNKKHVTTKTYSVSKNVLTVLGVKMSEYKIGNKYSSSYSAKVNGKYVYVGAKYCYGYACYIQYKLYGHCAHTEKNRFCTLSGSTNIKPSSSRLKKLITSAGVGAHIRTGTNRNGNNHSMVIVGITSKGFTVADANVDGTNRVDVRTYTWDSYLSSKWGQLGISFIKVHK